MSDFNRYSIKKTPDYESINTKNLNMYNVLFSLIYNVF